jgi:competence protein ComEC
MLATVVVAGRLRIHLDRWDILGVALLVVVLVDSMAVLAPGFWLSFGAVGLLMFSGGENVGPRRWWERWLRAQWAMFLGLAPLAVGLFQQVSIVAPVANAVAIPVVSFAVVPLSLLAAVSPWPWPAELAAGILSMLHRALEALSALPWASHVQHAPQPWALALAAGGAVWLLLPRGFPSRGLGLLALVPTPCRMARRPSPCWTSGRGWPWWCAPASTPCCSTPGLPGLPRPTAPAASSCPTCGGRGWSVSMR